MFKIQFHYHLFKKIIGYKLYQKNSGGIDIDKFNAFYDEYIKYYVI